MAGTLFNNFFFVRVKLASINILQIHELYSNTQFNSAEKKKQTKIHLRARYLSNMNEKKKPCSIIKLFSCSGLSPWVQWYTLSPFHMSHEFLCLFVY